MKLWLDDARPAPQGWVHVKTVQDAQRLLASGKVTHASLDHDLGPQPLCYECQHETQDCGSCHCHNRHSDGTDLCAWMAASDHWPANKPEVHSANPPGAAHMRAIIDQHFHAEPQQDGSGGQLKGPIN
jgi:hypothetical protein